MTLERLAADDVPSTDDALLVALRSGDRRAFGQVFDAWCDRVHDVAVHIVRDPAPVADAVQETFAVAWRKQESIDQSGSLGAWLLRIARSAALDRHVGNARRPGRTPGTARAGVVGGDIEVEDRLRSLTGAATVPGDEQIMDLLWEAAAALPARDLSVVDLELRHGLSHTDVAGIVGMPTDAAAQLVGRLHDRLGAAIRSRVLWRGGSPSCSGLAGRMRRARIDRFDADTVRIIQRHVSGCGGCVDRQALRTEPVVLFAALPLVAAPAELRRSVITSLSAAGIPLPDHAPADEPVPVADSPSTEHGAPPTMADAEGDSSTVAAGVTGDDGTIDLTDGAVVIDLTDAPDQDDDRCGLPARSSIVGDLLEAPDQPTHRQSFMTEQSASVTENPTALRATVASWADDDDASSAGSELAPGALEWEVPRTPTVARDETLVVTWPGADASLPGRSSTGGSAGEDPPTAETAMHIDWGGPDSKPPTSDADPLTPDEPADAVAPVPVLDLIAAEPARRDHVPALPIAAGTVVALMMVVALSLVVISRGSTGSPALADSAVTGGRDDKTATTATGDLPPNPTTPTSATDPGLAPPTDGPAATDGGGDSGDAGAPDGPSSPDRPGSPTGPGGRPAPDAGGTPSRPGEEPRPGTPRTETTVPGQTPTSRPWSPFPPTSEPPTSPTTEAPSTTSTTEPPSTTSTTEAPPTTQATPPPG